MNGENSVHKKVIMLNQQAVDQLAKEKLFGYGAVDEHHYQEHMKEHTKQQLVNLYSSMERPSKLFKPKEEYKSIIGNRDNDKEYFKVRETQRKERFEREISTKVKIIKLRHLKSYQLLKEAENILLNLGNGMLTVHQRNKLACLTLNNLGCFFQKLGFSKVALQHFNSVAKLENLLQADCLSKVSTMLNICANLSNLKRHSEALNYAKKSLAFLEHEMNEFKNKLTQGSGSMPPERKMSRKQAEFLKKKNLNANMPFNFWISMQISLYNQGVELEHLMRYPEAIESIEQAIEISEIQLNNTDSEFYRTMDNSIREIKTKHNNATMFSTIRRKKRDNLNIDTHLHNIQTSRNEAITERFNASNFGSRKASMKSETLSRFADAHMLSNSDIKSLFIFGGHE